MIFMSESENICALITIDDVENYVLIINAKLRDLGYQGNLIVSEVMIIFTKRNPASWNKKSIIPVSDDHVIEEKKIGLRLHRFEGNQYYFEKNGAIKCIDNTINNDKSRFKFGKNWKKTYDSSKNINENINNYIFKNCIEDLNEQEKSCLPAKTNYSDVINSFNIIPEVADEDKLPPYNRDTCIDVRGNQSETVYNSKVCQNNPTKYELLDLITLQGCEVADLHDKENNIYIHVKKRGDLRVLCSQITTGCFILKDPIKRQEYNDILKNKGKSQHNYDNFTFVAAIIGKNKKIGVKDKMSLGVTNFISKSLGIKLSLDYIDEVQG